ncbi:MAG: hypothetical protein N2249_01470 [Melioribacter sp.]|nr:hypothetical protein [Melioribacter sp.]
MKRIFTIKVKTKIFLNLCLLSILTTFVYAQESEYILNIKTEEAKEKSPLTFIIDLISTENISSIELAYKFSNQTDFKEIELQILGTTATVTIPADEVKPPILEYYFILNLKDGSVKTYPPNVESNNSALQLAISSIERQKEDIMILSPSENEIVTPADLLISISFIKAGENIDINKTKILLNQVDITQHSLNANDLIVISGQNIKNLKYGPAKIEIQLYDKDANLYGTLTRNIQIITPQKAEEITKKWNFGGSIKAESRNESFNKTSTWYNNLSAEARATSGNFLFSGQLYVTSEEKRYLQPYNRYTFTIRNGDLFTLQVGDSYPQFSDLIMNGKRVRGINGSLNLGIINLSATYGEITRKVEGSLLETFLKNQAPLAYDVIPINESKYNYPYGRVKLGTYSRKIFAVRPSFGSGENFQLGFSYLHSKDDPNSVEFAARPQENAVIGTDLMLALDQQNVVFKSQAAFSIFNKNISPGTLSDSQIDSIFGQGKAFDIDPENIKRIKKLLGKIITVNQYIGPLNPQKLASFAGEATLNINYFNNTVNATYIYRGNDYTSFGQNFIRTDVKGFNISDRIRMFNNQFFFTIGYEKLEDNLQKTKIATTTYETFNTTASLFLRANFPSITIGYTKYKNNNGINFSDSIYNNYIVNDVTNRLSLLLAYDIRLGVRHNTSLSLTTQKREDNSLLNMDASYNSISFSVNSYWANNLTSIFQLLYNSTEIANSQYEYFTITAGTKYRLFENRLLLSATLSPSFGDFDRQALEIVADYNLIRNLNIAFQTRILRFPGKSTNSFIGLVTRYVL